jgi:phosphomevalonate kinase
MSIEDLDIYKSLINKFDQNKKKVIDGLNKVQKILDVESKETSEMLEVYRRHMAGEKLDSKTISKANNQFTGLIKNAGLLGVFALPGGLDILPKSFKD